MFEEDFRNDTFSNDWLCFSNFSLLALSADQVHVDEHQLHVHGGAAVPFWLSIYAKEGSGWFSVIGT
jgi:hypothetical protein